MYRKRKAYFEDLLNNQNIRYMKKYSIELGEDHLIVLSDLIHRISESTVLDDFIVDQSEIQAIWHLEGLLEKITPSILSKSYLEELKEARDRYRHKD